jgi:hypothetical protein
LRLLKGLTFFGKRDLGLGISLPERCEIWKTFLGPLMALTVNTLLAAMRTARAAGTSLQLERATSQA